MLARAARLGLAGRGGTAGEEGCCRAPISISLSLANTNLQQCKGYFTWKPNRPQSAFICQGCTQLPYTRELQHCIMTDKLQHRVMQKSSARHCFALHYNALLATGAKTRSRYTDPGLFVKPCTLVHLLSRSRYTIQTSSGQEGIGLHANVPTCMHHALWVWVAREWER